MTHAHIARPGRLPLVLLVAIAAFLGGGATAAQALILVNSTVDDTLANLDANSTCDLREAIANANNNNNAYSDCAAGSGADTITFDPSLNGSTITLSSQLDFTGSTNISGPGADLLAISGGGTTRLFYFAVAGSAKTLTISGLTLRDGNADGNGGGVLYNNSMHTHAVTFDRVVMTGNTSASAANTIVAALGTLDITNSAIYGNFGTNSVIYSQDCDVTIANSTLSDSSSTAVRSHNLNALAKTLRLINTTITNTSRAVYLIVNDGTLIFEYQNSIFSNNANGSILTGGALAGTSSLVITSLGNNILSDTPSGNSAHPAGPNDLRSTDPLLWSFSHVAGTFVYPLQVGSPAIDAGDAAACAAAPVGNVDQRGVTRPRDGDGDSNAVCDIGAFELDEFTKACMVYGSPYILGTDNPDLVADLRAVIACANAGISAVEIIDLAGQTVTLPDAPAAYDGNGYNGLPPITSNFTLRNGTLERSSSLLTCAAGNDRERFRLLEVSGGGLTLEGVTLRNGCAYQGTGSSLANTGGAVLVTSGALAVLGSHFDGNGAYGGGAIYTESHYTLVNSSFVGNSADNVGSALWTKVTTGSNWIVNTTFSGNGDFAYYSDDAVGLATAFVNTTFADHTGFTPLYAANMPALSFSNTLVDHSAGSGDACGISGATVTESNNYASDSSCGFTTNAVASAPLGALTQAANGVFYHPLADGAAIDGGDATLLPSEADLELDIDGDDSFSTDPIDVDIRGAGFVRVSCGQVDLGAAERQNCAPTGVQLSPSSIAESAAIGSLVGTLSTTDANPGDTHTYAFVSNPGNLFQISAGNELRTAAVLDYETASSHAITIRTTDSTGASFDQPLTITVIDVQHQVTPSAGSGGTLSPSSAQSVDHGATTAFTVTPDPGYAIPSVTGCGGSLVGTTYTTGAITSDCTVTASFGQLSCAGIVAPADGAMGVAVTAALGWSLPAGATGAHLSFGTDGGGLVAPTNLLAGTDQGTATSYDPTPDLAQTTTYYWQVVPDYPFGTALNCPIWSFTTLTDTDGDGIPDGDDTCPLIPDPTNADLDRPAGSVAHWGFNDGTGAVASDSVGGHDGSVTGATWVNGQVDGALSFDGSGDSVIVPHASDFDFDANEEMTIALWLKLPQNQVNTGSSVNNILSKRPTGGGPFPFYIYVRNQTHARAGEVELRRGVAGDLITITSPTRIDDDQWHHLSFVVDADELRAYVDGSLTQTIANTLSGSASSTADVAIGAGLTGVIDGITVVRRALAGYEIAALAASSPSADGSGNVCDVCPGLPDPDQTDSDGDGLGDACDAVDLSLSVADVADPVLEGQPLSYTLDVTNAGPSAATDVVLTAAVPASTTFVDATGSGWACSESAGSVSCLRPTLAVGAAPTVTLELTAPLDSGAVPSVQLAASLASTDVEAWPGDQNAMETTTIGPLPVVSIADAQMVEGSNGNFRVMVFTLTMSEPPLLPVELFFATADGTATTTGTGGSFDYRPITEEIVNFAVGQTSGQARVSVVADTFYELDETFTVTLLPNSTNVALGDATATGTILNDDALVQRTLVVNDVGDAVANDGVCTLREAVSLAEQFSPGWGTPGECGQGQPYLPGEPLTRDRIVFDLPGAGPTFTILPTSALPAITDAVEIDGTTQPGADCTSWPPTLAVVLDGSAMTVVEEDGMVINAADSIVRGLVIRSFPGDGVDIGGDAARLSCNYIGTGASGNVNRGNGGAGVRIAGGASGVLIGTDGDGTGDATEGNLISGNVGGGIHVIESGGVIAGNLIGPSADGSCGIGNGIAGVIADDSVELLIGADLDDPAGVEGNFIGCNAPHGVVVSGASTDALEVRGNDIRDSSDAGIAVSGVLGDVIIDSNLVSVNGGAGISVASDARGVHLRRNALEGNDGLGIDLVDAGDPADGVTANDPGDADVGANDLQNYPVLDSALFDGTSVAVEGYLDSVASTDFRIEFYASDEVDASGHGEGARFLGELAVSTDAGGHANFSTSLSGIASDEWLSATATDASGNTSEFSAVRSILIGTTLAIDSHVPDPSAVGQAFTVQLSLASADPVRPATGSVAVSAAGAGNCVAVLANGSASCQLTGTTPGPTTIEASYAGNSSHAAASASAAHSIGLAPSSTTITADTPDPSNFGEAVTVIVSVTSAGGTPTGSVSIGDGLGTSCNAPLSGGVGSCALVPAQGGVVTLSADYPGDGSFLASSDTEPHQVLAVASTLAILAHTPDPSVAGQPVNVSVQLSSSVGTPAGPVVVSDGTGASCQVSGASGNCNLIPTGIGSVQLGADFAGDANHLASTASSAHQIDRASTTTVAGAPFPPQFPTEPPRQFAPLRFPVAIDVLAPGAGTTVGTITVEAAVGNENCAIVLPANHCDLLPQTAGARDYTITYGGDTRFLPSTASVQVQVLPDPLFRTGFEE